MNKSTTMEDNFNIKKIIRVEGKGLNTRIFFAGEYSESVGNSIDELEKEFSEWGFVRIHTNHLINPEYYKKTSQLTSSAVEMSDGTLLPADSNLVDLSQETKSKTWWSRMLRRNRNKFIKSNIMKKQLLILIVSFITVLAIAQDYSIPMTKQYWTTTHAGPLEESGGSIKCYTVGWKNGNSMQSRQVFNFLDKDIYIKWQKNDESDGTDITGIIGIKMTRAGTHDLSNATRFPNNTWLYTMIHVNSGDSSLTVTTCTNNYYDQGGSSTWTDYNYQKIVPGYWHNYVNGVLSFYFNDVINRHAYLEVAEVIIADSSPKLLETEMLYDFNDGNIPGDITTQGTWEIDTINSPNGNSMYYDYVHNGDYFSLDVTNANAVNIRYKANYNGGTSAPDNETITGCAITTGGINRGLGVNSSGTTLYSAEWQDVIIPVCDTATTNVKLYFYSNGGDIWIDEIRVLKEKVTNSAPTLIELTNYSFYENSPPGTVVGVVNVNDADTNDKHFLELVEVFGDEDNDYFRFKGDSLILKKSISYEDTASLNIHIQATDESLANIDLPFTINVIDVNEFPPNIPAGQVFSVDENSASDTSVGTVIATDEDGDAVLTYSIESGNEAGMFSINSSTGEVTCANSSLDFESTNQYILGVQVSDGDNSFVESVTININDVAEAPVIEASQVFDIDENSASGESVDTVQATGNSLTYSITSGNDDSMFSINPSNGVITTTSALLDFETTPQYTLGIHVTDGSLTDDETITININDVNEAPVVTTSQVFSINENSPSGTSLGSVLATDVDAGATLTYSLVPGPGNTGEFAISSTGELTSATDALNFETKSSYTLDVKVSDGEFSDTKSITINIKDVNEAPVITASQIFSIDENSASGTSLGSVLATDVDAGATLTYSLVPGPGNTGEFAISLAGELTSATDALDFETKSSYTLDVKVSDGEFADTKSITININNINDNPPVIESAEITIDEGTANGTVIYTLSYSDSDGNLNPLTFTPTAGHDALDLSGDDIVVVDETKLDYESDQTIVLSGFVSDGTFTDNAILTIHLNNINDNTPVMANVEVNVPEREINGRVVFTFNATDADGDLNPINYAFVTGHDHAAFTITEDQLIVNDGSKLNFETEPTINLQVEISDGTNTSIADIIVTVTDIADDAPSITVQPQSAEVCYGQQTILSVTAEGDGSLNYDWLENGISLGKPNSSTLVLEVGEANETSSYSCKITNNFGEVTSLGVTAKMREPLTVDLGEDRIIAANESVLLDAGEGYAGYEWSDNSDAQTLLFEGSTYGVGHHNVGVIVTDDFGCTATDDVSVDVSVATATPETNFSDVKIYPNPARGFVFAEVSGISEALTIEFINMAGQRALLKQIAVEQSAEKIDLTGLKKGLYIVRIYNDNYQKTESLIIH